ncbi:MAG: glycosyltransferase family 4 protein [Acidimicrobiales bacterium]|nr:glycosyltransferase family 4 protein [Acidimicrobiales bacterium]
MRLLVITPHLSPDTAPTGVVVSRIVDELGTAGHDVHVVTSLPWYRDHRVEDGWRGRLVRRGSQGSASVVRLQPFAGRKERLVGRAFGFAMFSGTAALAAVAARGPFDAVMALSPPLTLGPAGWVAARRHRCPLVLNVQDVFPDVAIEVGAITSPRVIRLFRSLERFCYRRSDAVTVLSDDLAANVTAKLGGSSRDPLVRVIPNFVDTTTIRPLDRDTAYRGELGLGDRTVVMYAGNLGHSQPLDIIVEAARRHRDRDDIAYVINGGGVAAEGLHRAAEDLPNLTVVGYQPADRVPEVMASADVHVVALRRGLSASSVPSKMYSILAAGRPLIASVDEGSEVARVVGEARAGVAVPPEDVDAFVAAVERLVGDAGARASMGDSGRAWAQQWASPRSVTDSYVRLVEELRSR